MDILAQVTWEVQDQWDWAMHTVHPLRSHSNHHITIQMLLSQTIQPVEGDKSLHFAHIRFSASKILKTMLDSKQFFATMSQEKFFWIHNTFHRTDLINNTKQQDMVLKCLKFHHLNLKIMLKNPSRLSTICLSKYQMSSSWQNSITRRYKSRDLLCQQQYHRSYQKYPSSLRERKTLVELGHHQKFPPKKDQTFLALSQWELMKSSTPLRCLQSPVTSCPLSWTTSRCSSVKRLVIKKGSLTKSKKSWKSKNKNKSSSIWMTSSTS